MHHVITAEFSLNTPLFSSGADPAKPELRVSEIKAALRFWWRAMNYGLYLSSPNQFVDMESQLFGSSKSSHGQGVLVSLAKVTGLGAERHIKDVHADFQYASGARYLGFGLMEYAHANANPETNKSEKFAGQLLRACIDPGGSFTIRLIWRDAASRTKVHRDKTLSNAEFQANLLQAIKGFGLFGGLGSRSRRGFGSVSLITLTAENEPAWAVGTDAPSLRSGIQTLLKTSRSITTATPEDVAYSAFTAHTRSTVVNMHSGQKTNGYAVLNAMGSAFVRYRAWGRNNKILDRESANQIFVDDHNWLRGGDIREGFKHPDRIVFGLPHPYDKKIWGGDDTRRASPLFFHVHRATPSVHLGLIFDLRSMFLPSGTTLKDPKSNTKVTVSPDWTLLNDMLDGEFTQQDSTGKQFQRALFTDATCTKIF